VTSASRELLSPRQDVWALVAEPYNLPDWWRAYTGVVPDRRGLAEHARWKVVRRAKPGIFTRAGSEGLIVITRVVEGLELGFRDVDEGIEALLELANAGPDRTRATISVTAPSWRLLLEGVRNLPRQSLANLHELCQTAATL
jgi:uncharacterized protein YndB with AHSA1/START domain